MHQVSRGLLVVLVSLLIGYANPLRADLHTWDINEIFSSADGLIQYIELQERGGQNGQDNLSSSGAFPNHTITSNSKSYTFTSDLPSVITANKFFLIATPGFAALPGAVTPDYTFSAAQTPFFSTLGDTLTFSNVDGFTFTGAQLPLNGHSALRDNGTVVENSPTNFAGQSGHIVVPEPAAWALLAMGGACFYPWLRRKYRR